MKWPIISIIVVIIVIALVVLYFTGVLGPLLGSESSQNGNLDMTVHDAPCGSCAHVWVTFASVAVLQSNQSNGTSGTWMTTSASSTTMDLMAMNGTSNARTFATVSLKTGGYDHFRVMVQNVTVELVGGVTIQAVLEGPTVEINHSLAISGGATTTMDLDLNLAQSLVVIGSGASAQATFTPVYGSVTVTGS